MANGVDVSQSSNPWSVAFHSGGGQTLPFTLWPGDLIPKRIRWISPTGSAGDQVIIVDVQGNRVYEEILTSTPGDPSEQRPRLHEKWIGYFSPLQNPAPPNTGITITRMDSGTLLIYL